MQLLLDGMVVLTVYILAIAYLGQKKGNRKVRSKMNFHAIKQEDSTSDSGEMR